jgi:hypothetical protein
MITKLVVTHYALVTDGVWEVSGSTIDDAYDVNVNGSLGSAKDTFSFKLPNPRGTNKQTVNPQDIVEVHLLINNEVSGDSNLIMYGLVKKVTGDFTPNNTYLRIEGVSFGEITTNALVFYDAADTTQNVMQFIESCLNSVALRNTNFNITWNASNPSIKANGSALPTYTDSSTRKREFDKSFATILDRLLVNEYTGDGDYYWFVNNQKELVIRRRLPGTINYYWTEGSSFKSVKFNINAEDIRNFIVVKCGVDHNGNPITTRYDDPVSRSQHGFRYYLLVDTQIAKNLIDSGLYPSNDDLRVAAKAIGQDRGKVFADAHNKGFIQATCTLAPTTNYNVGNNIALTSTKYATKDAKHVNGLTNYPMRIKEINYTIDNVNIILEEEVASA